MATATQIGNWKTHDRHFVKGDILRCKVENRDNKHYGEYAYGVCTGDGFGCSPSSMGNAIYMAYQGYDLAPVIMARRLYMNGVGERDLLSLLKTPNNSGERWEAFWGIEYMDPIPEPEGPIPANPTTRRLIQVTWKGKDKFYDYNDENIMFVGQKVENRGALGKAMGDIAANGVEGDTMTVTIVSKPIAWVDEKESTA